MEEVHQTGKGQEVPRWQGQKQWATPHHGKDCELGGQAPCRKLAAWDPPLQVYALKGHGGGPEGCILTAALISTGNMGNDPDAR